MPVTRSMSSLLVSRLTFAPAWPCGTETAPRRTDASTSRDPRQLAVLTAHDEPLIVRHTRRGRVVGVDDDLGGLTEKLQLRVEPAHLPPRNEHQRSWLPQRHAAGRRAREERGASLPTVRCAGPPTAPAVRDRLRPSRSRRARRTAHGRPSSPARASPRRWRGCRPAHGRGVDRSPRAPTTSNVVVPTGATRASVCCAETRGLRMSHRVTSGRSS